MNGEDEDEERDEPADCYEEAHGNDLTSRVLRPGVGSVRKGKGLAWIPIVVAIVIWAALR